jgi:putative peptidoglycan lipid II flippase
MFASLLAGGRLSALSYAQRITALQYDLLVRPLQRSTYPHFARLTAEGKFPALSRRLFLYLRVMFFATVPVAVLVAMLADPIVRLLFQRGAFDDTSVRLTSQALALYALGVPAMAMSRIIDRTFVTLKDTVTPTRWALVRIGIKIALSFVLIRPLAHLGIAVAEVASQVVRLPFLFRALPREIRRGETGPTLASFGRTVAAATAMAAAISVAAAGMVGTLALPVELVALAVLGTGVFAAIGFAILNEEARTVLGALGALRPRPSSDRPRPEES